MKTAALDDILSGSVNEEVETTELQESYRRTVARGAVLVNNDLFVDFD